MHSHLPPGSAIEHNEELTKPIHATNKELKQVFTYEQTQSHPMVPLVAVQPVQVVFLSPVHAVPAEAIGLPIATVEMKASTNPATPQSVTISRLPSGLFSPKPEASMKEDAPIEPEIEKVLYTLHIMAIEINNNAILKDIDRTIDNLKKSYTLAKQLSVLTLLHKNMRKTKSTAIANSKQPYKKLKYWLKEKESSGFEKADGTRYKCKFKWKNEVIEQISLSQIPAKKMSK